MLGFVLHSFRSPLESKREMMQENRKVKMLSRFLLRKKKSTLCYYLEEVSYNIRSRRKLANKPTFFSTFYQYQSLFLMTVLD